MYVFCIFLFVIKIILKIKITTINNNMCKSLMLMKRQLRKSMTMQVKTKTMMVDEHNVMRIMKKEKG